MGVAFMFLYLGSTVDRVGLKPIGPILFLVTVIAAAAMIWILLVAPARILAALYALNTRQTLHAYFLGLVVACLGNILLMVFARFM
jgi:hypothetical protein